MTAGRQPRALLLTVGTGNVDKVRETLIEPIKLSVREGQWTRVVLLPSRLTVDAARTLQAELQEELMDAAVELAPLPRPGDEDDADACFAHFDRVIAGLRGTGIGPHDIVVDFTRGTKAMSAALVLAAVRHGLPRLRYISSSQPRDVRGMVVPGAERLVEVQTTIASARRTLDRAREFFRAGNFAAVLAVLPGPEAPWPADLLDVARFVRPLAEFYAEWDRLDYKAAARVVLPELDAGPWEWRGAVPTTGMRDWVVGLAAPRPADHRDQAARLRRLVCDLLANGERRIEGRRYEDAALRGYRVVEAVGQARLFECGFDPAALPPDHPAVGELQERLGRKKKEPLSVGRDRSLKAGRFQVAYFLHVLNDPLAKALLDFENEDVIRWRNKSILIHGFDAVGVDDDEPLRRFYERLEALIIEDAGPTARDYLALARFHERTSL